MSMSKALSNYRKLSVEQWHAMAVDGVRIPVSILIAGDSMRPLIRRDMDKVTIMPVEHEPKVGEIVLFPSLYLHEKETYVIHRIYRKQGQQVQTMGDNCRRPDRWMAMSQIWGVVVKIERGSRTINPNKKNWYFFGRCWMFLFPLRRVVSRIRRLCHSICASAEKQPV